MNVFHQCERDQQRDEIDGDQREVAYAGLEGLQTALEAGQFSRSPADVQVTDQNKGKREPEYKNRVQAADNITWEVVVAGQPVDLAMVTKVAVDYDRAAEGEPGQQAHRHQHGHNDEEPERGDHGQHEAVRDLDVVVQWKDDCHQPVVGERHQVEGLHGEAGVAEEQEGHAVVVGKAPVVEQKDVEQLGHQG